MCKLSTKRGARWSPYMESHFEGVRGIHTGVRQLEGINGFIAYVDSLVRLSSKVDMRWIFWFTCELDEP